MELSSSFAALNINSPHAERFFHHFVKEMPNILTLPTEENDEFFVSVIVAIARRDKMVSKALLCVGSSHLINNTPAAETRSVAEERLKLLQEAEKEISSRIAAMKTADPEALLAGYLLLYLYELSEGTGNGAWRVRLDGARRVVFNMLGGIKEPSREDLEGLGINQSLVQFFIYHDTLASVTIQQPSRKILISKKPSNNQNEHVFGANNGLLNFIARVSALHSEARAAGAISSPIIAQTFSIWKDIDKWRPPVYGSDDEESFDYRNMCEAYVAAIFIWLFFIVYPDNLADDKVQVMVRKGLESLDAIDDPWLMSFGLFPAFLIAVACVQVQDRELLEEQLDRIEEARRFRNVQVCRNVIRSSWACYDAGERKSWDWIRLMKAQGLSMSVT